MALSKFLIAYWLFRLGDWGQSSHAHYSINCMECIVSVNRLQSRLLGSLFLDLFKPAPPSLKKMVKEVTDCNEVCHPRKKFWNINNTFASTLRKVKDEMFIFSMWMLLSYTAVYPITLQYIQGLQMPLMITYGILPNLQDHHVGNKASVSRF